ncbi:MAG: siphovirus ReqiPepy6 Gp37-like family protein [Oscillospiraceae bacterium]|nr:siphovirus ReqiPepy6 Gp37-like family protein [Oscillospiraceae bacterium]
MNLFALDSSLNMICQIKNTIVIMWIRRYYECGEFSVYMPAVDYSIDMAYIYTPDRLETGIIQKVQYDDKLSGEYITLSGFFLEKRLDDRIIYPRYRGSGNIESIGRSLITSYGSDIPKLTLGAASGHGTTISMQETGAELGKRIYKLYQTQEMSFRLNYVFTDDKIYFETYQGLDRTQGQSVNNFVVFSKGFHNVSNVQYIHDISNHKNYAVIGGEGEGTNRTYVIVDKSDSGLKRMIFVDARNLQMDSAQTQAEYESDLKQRGNEALDDYQIVESLDFDVIANSGYKYRVDYDLGDKCDIVISKLGLSYSARIVEAREVIKENYSTVELLVGSKTPTLYKKIKMEA